MASPRAKYSNSASTMISASARATQAVDAHNTSPTTNGIKTTAVATRFQVIAKESPRHTARKVNSRRFKVEMKNSEAGNLSLVDPRGNFGFWSALVPAALAALTFLKLHKRLKQTRTIKIRPQRFGYENFRVGDLPQQEIADAHLSAGANQQIRVRQSRGVQTLRHFLFGDGCAQPLGIALRQDGVQRVHNLRPASIIQRQAQDHAAILCRLF